MGEVVVVVGFDGAENSEKIKEAQRPTAVW
jgi:hypothetical protein